MSDSELRTWLGVLTAAIIVFSVLVGIDIHVMGKIDNTLNKIHDRTQEMVNETR